jgi:hypothetical protein
MNAGGNRGQGTDETCLRCAETKGEAKTVHAMQRASDHEWRLSG